MRYLFNNNSIKLIECALAKVIPLFYYKLCNYTFYYKLYNYTSSFINYIVIHFLYKLYIKVNNTNIITLILQY